MVKEGVEPGSSKLFSKCCGVLMTRRCPLTCRKCGRWDSDPPLVEKPSCGTCPLGEEHDPMKEVQVRVLCHASVMNGSTADFMPIVDWYCELHPLYPAWSEQELKRRLAKSNS
jgi:hypothetical protein